MLDGSRWGGQVPPGSFGAAPGCMGLWEHDGGFLARFIRVAESDEPDESSWAHTAGWEMATWHMAGGRARGCDRAGRITIKIMIKIKSCRFQSKAPEMTGAVQKLRQFRGDVARGGAANGRKFIRDQLVI